LRLDVRLEGGITKKFSKDNFSELQIENLICVDLNSAKIKIY